jgi:hypothetical protein
VILRDALGEQHAARRINMGSVARVGDGLAWLGRQGTRAIAVCVFLGLAVPQLSALFRPIVAPAIFCLLVLAFLRVEPAALRGEFDRRRLLLLLVATAWIMIVTPLVLGGVYLAVGGGELWSELSLALIMQAAAPPITSAPAFVALLGLDVAFALAALITTTTVTPLTSPFFAALFAGGALPLDAAALALRLAFFLGGSYIVALFIRRVLGNQRVRDWREHIDGLSVIALFVFAVALMGVVTMRFLADPLLVLALTGLSFVITFGLMATTALLFLPVSNERSLALAVSSGTRNMGLMLAAATGVSDMVWLYFAVAQFPIYLAPQLLYPLVSRTLRR